jgi:hypothetical protein
MMAVAKRGSAKIGGLHQMRAGARADHEEEGVLDLPVKPDDAGEPAEHLALTALDADLRTVAARRIAGAQRHLGHARAPATGAFASLASRAARSFKTNCAALTT